MQRAGVQGDGAGVQGDGVGVQGDAVGVQGDGAGVEGDGAGVQGDGAAVDGCECAGLSGCGCAHVGPTAPGGPECVCWGGDSRWVPGAPGGSAQRRGGGGDGGGVESIPELHPPVPAPPDPRPSAGTAGR